MRPPVADIAAPPFPRGLTWIGVEPLRMDKQLGRPVLVEFWDFCRVNSLRTMPYLKAWHERYADDGLRVIGIHHGGFPCSQDPETVRDACARLEVPYPVVVDERAELWEMYGNEGWPARYLFNAEGFLADLHAGEGAYADTEGIVQELLGVQRDMLAPLHPEDDPHAILSAQTEDQPGAYSGPYEAGGAWGVFEGAGRVTVGGDAFTVSHPGCYPLLEHARHTAGVLHLDVGEGVVCHATCFTPGVVPEA